MNDVTKGPRIALVGSCQLGGIRAAFLKLCPDADIKFWHLSSSRETKEQIAAQLGQYDLIVSQVREQDQNAPLALQRLQETHRQVVYVPVLVFNGFHPDCVHMLMKAKQQHGPLAHVQSAIIGSAYVLEVPEQRVPRLFNAFIYSCLGYFEAFDVACDLMLRNYASAGFDLAPHVDTLKRTSGSFMHTFNHPRIEFLTRLAHMIGSRAGLIDHATALPEGVKDDLASGVRWPVYPEIARRLGLQNGDAVFKYGRREFDLVTTVGHFYKFYQNLDRDAVRAAVPARLVEALKTALAT